jgi:hypothetical protein
VTLRGCSPAWQGILTSARRTPSQEGTRDVNGNSRVRRLDAVATRFWRKAEGPACVRRHRGPALVLPCRRGSRHWGAVSAA